MNKVLPGNTNNSVFPGKSYYIMSRCKPMAYMRMEGSNFGAHGVFLRSPTEDVPGAYLKRKEGDAPVSPYYKGTS